MPSSSIVNGCIIGLTITCVHLLRYLWSPYGFRTVETFIKFILKFEFLLKYNGRMYEIDKLVFGGALKFRLLTQLWITKKRFEKHAMAAAESCNYRTQVVRRVRSSAELAQTLARRLILSRIDYCNALLALPPALFDCYNECRTM